MDDLDPGSHVEADDPLPGLEAHGQGSAAQRAEARSERTEGVDPCQQGHVLPDWWETHYEEWIESLRRVQSGSGEPPGSLDPMPLRGGERCDRCDELAMIATEHVWTPGSAGDLAALAPIASPDASRSMWRSGVLLWCARHARDNELELLAAGAVVVGVRGSR